MNSRKTKPVSEGIKKNQSLRKALQILEGMAVLSTPARLQDIAKSLKMPQSTLLRFLNTFIDFGYVGQEPHTSCYYLTLKLVNLGSRARGNFPFQSSLIKYVKQISETFDESASLCIEQNMRMVYIAIEEGSGRMLQTLHHIGHVAPMHATGVGKLHLLNYSEEQLVELEKKFGFPQYTKHTITDMESLKKEIVWVQKSGYAMDNEECEEGVRCIAVPVKNFEGKVVAAISISAPVTRMDKKKIEEIIPFIKDISQKASRELGYAPQ
jgi:DNA-binding IclR family transcriptional regulator